MYVMHKEGLKGPEWGIKLMKTYLHNSALDTVTHDKSECTSKLRAWLYIADVTWRDQIIKY